MTIDEAIEIKTRTGDQLLESNLDEFDEADRLSIEALKRCQILAKNDPYWMKRPLQGETK